MQWYDRIRQVKFLLIFVAVLITAVSLVVSHSLVRDLEKGERQNMEVWAEAMRTLNNADEYTDVALVLKVLNGNNTIPVIVLSKSGEVQSFRNLQIQGNNAVDSLSAVKRMADEMRKEGRVIRIYLNEAETHSVTDDYMEICYDDSIMLKRLSSYPYVQLSVVLVLLFFLFLHCSVQRNQNRTRCGSDCRKRLHTSWELRYLH